MTTGITYSQQLTNYTKVGNLICVWIDIVLTSKGGLTDDLAARNMPFASGRNAPFSIYVANTPATLTLMRGCQPASPKSISTK